jgi:hypothetical protein
MGAAANVAGGEHARAAGLERQRPATVDPGGAIPGAGGVGAGEDEALLVQGELVPQPARVGLHADEHEHGPRIQDAPLPGPVVPDHDRLQRGVPEQLPDLGLSRTSTFGSRWIRSTR